MAFQSIVVLTGAGLSAESGLGTFRGTDGLWDQFDGHVISEDIGALKPSAKMFDAALLQAGLTRADAHHVVMVGNNLERDIAGKPFARRQQA